MLSLPIMLTMFIQMMYNLTDMLWIGRLGSGPVAAVGTAGFFLWFCNSIMMATKTGVEVGVSQSVGRNDLDSAKAFAKNSVRLAFYLSIFFGVLLFVFARQLLGFFHLGVTATGYNPTKGGIGYLRIVSFGTIFLFLNPTFSGIFNALGNSKLPFKYNVTGLIINAGLDPLLIYGIGPFPRLEVNGAAIATVFAQFVVFILFFLRFQSKQSPLHFGFFIGRLQKVYLKPILKFGSPVAIQSALFSIFGMIIARILAAWGPVPIAVQRVGSQIEAISWMTAGGFSTALSAFTGQNYGAMKFDRIKKGYYAALAVMGSIGLFASLLLITIPGPIFHIFIQEKGTLPLGIDYLRILGYSQLFMCIEITTGGAFNGLGRAYIPAIVSIVWNALRIPLALFLSSKAILGLNGIWWSVSSTSIVKGILLFIWFLIFYRSFTKSRELKSERVVIPESVSEISS